MAILALGLTLALGTASIQAHAATAKSRLPDISITGSVQSTSDSRQPEGASVAFTQSITLKPKFPTFRFQGATAQMSLQLKSVLATQELSRGPGYSREEYTASFAVRDQNGRVQLSASAQQKLRASLYRGDPLRTGLNLQNGIGWGVTFALPASMTLSANTGRTISAMGSAGALTGSESFSGSYSLEHRTRGSHILLARGVTESKAFATSHHSAAESTRLLFEQSRKFPVGTLQARYDLNENTNSALAFGGPPRTSRTEKLDAGIAGKLGRQGVEYKANLVQQRQIPSPGQLSETQKQSVDISYDLPLPGSSSGTVAVKSEHQQATGTTLHTSSDLSRYSLSLRLTPEINFKANASEKNTTNLELQQAQTRKEDIGASVSYSPHSRFQLNGGMAESTTRDFRGQGAEYTSRGFSLSADALVRKSFRLNFSLSDSSAENVPARLLSTIRQDDALKAQATLTYSPRPGLSLRTGYVTTAKQSRPGHRTVDSNLTINLGYALSNKVSWNFTYRGKSFTDRDDPLRDSDTNTMTSSFTIKF